jgi:hypothetical protein
MPACGRKGVASRGKSGSGFGEKMQGFSEKAAGLFAKSAGTFCLGMRREWNFAEESGAGRRRGGVFFAGSYIFF